MLGRGHSASTGAYRSQNIGSKKRFRSISQSHIRCMSDCTQATLNFGFHFFNLVRQWSNITGCTPYSGPATSCHSSSLRLGTRCGFQPPICSLQRSCSEYQYTHALYNRTVLLQVSFTTFDKGWTLPNGLEAEKFPWMKKLEDHWFLYIRNVSVGWRCLQAVLERRFVFF